MVTNEELRDLRDKEGIRSQLHEIPDIFFIPLLVSKELSLESLSTRVTTQEIFNGSNDSFVVGHPQNGVVGTTTGIGGNQVVVGSFKGPLLLLRVTNPGNVFKDYLRDYLHWDLVNSTANVDITNHKIVF